MKVTKHSKDLIAQQAKMIEKTLDAFGIQARIVEVINNENNIHYSLEVVVGTRMDDILALDKDLAIALAAPGGKIEIQAPVPGRSLIGIIVPKHANTTYSKEKQSYKIIRIKEKEYVTFDTMERLKNGISQLLFIIAYLIVRLAEKIKSQYTIENKEVLKKTDTDNTSPNDDKNPLFNSVVHICKVIKQRVSQKMAKI